MFSLKEVSLYLPSQRWRQPVRSFPQRTCLLQPPAQHRSSPCLQQAPSQPSHGEQSLEGEREREGKRGREGGREKEEMIKVWLAVYSLKFSRGIGLLHGFTKLCSKTIFTMEKIFMVIIILDCSSQCTSIPEDWRLKEQFNVEWEVESLFPWQHSSVQDSCKLKHTSRNMHVYLSSPHPPPNRERDVSTRFWLCVRLCTCTSTNDEWMW